MTLAPERQASVEPRASWDPDRWLNLPALTAVGIWSGVFPFAKYALTEFPVWSYTALRPLLASLLVFGYLRLRRQPIGVERRDWPRLAAASLGGMAVFQIFFMLGLARTSASHSALLIAGSPLLGAAVLWLLRTFQPTRPGLAGLLLGFSGVALIVRTGDVGGASVTGDLLTIVAALGWVVVTTVPAPLIGKYGPIRITAWLVLGAGLVALMPALRELDQLARDVPSTLAWLSVLYTAVLGTFIANALWQRAVHALGSTQTIVYIYLQPLLAVALAALLLGERLAPIQLAGGLLILVALGLVRR